MNVKNAIATGLLLFGLGIIIAGIGKVAEPTIDNTYPAYDKEITQVMKNSDTQHFNWRVFLGGLTTAIALGLFVFPSAKKLETERYGR